jgi:hypothetical protein
MSEYAHLRTAVTRREMNELDRPDIHRGDLVKDQRSAHLGIVRVCAGIQKNTRFCCRPARV